ncbi:beta-ketoacyl-ACP synthase [Pseudoalteromonas denitrificans]|uniref:3-oxoacyl-[acyl-carrier-protein] synthase-1 n=1 Tax=Pseudoalteromonas denitrificans DSM 6059 TaxID=1123010 RepID=A0A1I1I8Z9_9GAMM|nr:beta-ketoacyl-ACP synthase [Pseudoalteromonas denitrificans]SFC30233.1 3-oxoacyl-[acyl-carrier-protein] synthase-1 [Pseudoalteromonas denitrificans DSM 6059]
MGICLKDVGIVCNIGQSKQAVLKSLIDGNANALVKDTSLPLTEPQFVGHVALNLDDKLKAPSSRHSSRNNQLAYHAFKQIESSFSELAKNVDKKRIAVIIGTSTSGIAEGENARKTLAQSEQYPDDFHYQTQEMIAPAHFIADLCQATGPVYSISTACSSSAKALVSAKALIEADIADIVIAGGVDSLARLTINGFKSLESVSNGKCAPFSQGRDGINIGEAAALFVIHSTASGIQLMGFGETSDAYHVSSPSPDGSGAISAMELALDMAQIESKQIDYVNLHGTATVKNDEMESLAMHTVCGNDVFCGSTKGMTGHTLGAAGALEAAICWLLLSDINSNNEIPANVGYEQQDSNLPEINLSQGQKVSSLKYCMSNSFAFGGNNLSLVLGK